MAVASEQELRALGKQFGTIIPKHEPVPPEEITRLESVLLQLLNAVEFPQLRPPHRAAACNALCGFVDATSNSGISNVRSVILNPVSWKRLRSFYLDRYQDASPRSMKQFLTTLLNLIRASQEEPKLMTSKWAEDVGQICLRSISSHTDLSSLKPSILFLQEILHERLLEKGVLIELAATAQQELEPDSLLAQDKLSSRMVLHQLVVDILQCCKHADIATSVGRLLRTIFAKTTIEVPTDVKISPSSDMDEPIWLPPVLEMIKEDSSDVDNLERHILPQLLASDESSLLQLFRRLPFQQLLDGNNNNIDEADIRISMLMITVIGTMKLSSALTSQIQLLVQTPLADIREKLAISCLQHQSAFIRIDAVNLIVGTVTTAHPFPEAVLHAVQPALRSLFLESDAKVRGEVLNILKYLTRRLCLVMNKLKKASEYEALMTKLEADHIDQSNALEQHKLFVRWFYEFLCEGLRPSASYQSHIMSLRALCLHSTLALFSACEINLFTAAMVRQLTDLALDPFDDVRHFSAALLANAEQLGYNLFDPTLPDSFTSVAKSRMIATGRACISDGYARLIELSHHNAPWLVAPLSPRFQIVETLLEDINQGLNAAELDILDAVKHPQLHGQFSALRYIITSPSAPQMFETDGEWTLFNNTVINYCTRAWEIVKPVLCIDSPEGHGDEDDIKDAGIGVKDTLSYSWRALKEASALLQSLIEQTRLNGLSFEDSSRIGDLYFTQLSELRHRGAFSSVAQCFTSCCIKDGHPAHGSGLLLVKRWYKQLLELIDAKSVALTRRSAGLPAIVIAIFSADPDNVFLDTAFDELRSIASRDISMEHRHGETGLPQVHAMNCLRAIFGSSRLASIAERHLETTVQIAAQSLDHDIWSIRNCGGMLLKAILIRLHSGVNAAARENRSGYQNFAREVYRRYPSLADAVESLLQASMPSSDMATGDQTSRQVNNVFPALEIIERIGVKKERMAIVQGLLVKLLESSVWFIRERAAAAISRLTDSGTILVIVQSTFDSTTKTQVLRANTLHGRLLCLKASMEQCLPASPGPFLLQLLENFEAIISLSCPLINEVYFDIQAVIIRGILVDSPVSKATLPANDTLRLRRCLLVLQNLVTEQERASPAAHNLLVLLKTWLYLHNSNKYQDLNLSLGINKDNISFVIQLLSEQAQRQPQDWSLLLPMLTETCTKLIQQDCEGDTALNAIESLTILLVRNREVIMLVEDRDPWSESLKSLLLACETIHGKSRMVSRASLELSGALLTICQQNSHFIARFAKWTRRIRCALDDELDLAMRLSAMQALDNAKELVRQHLWSISGAPLDQDGALLLGILFDGLVDDDEDVRSLVGRVVTYVVRSSKIEAQNAPSLNAVTAQEMLLQHTIKHGAHSSALFLEFMTRLLSFEANRQLSSRIAPDQGSESLGKLTAESKTMLSPLAKRETSPLEFAVQNAMVKDNVLFEIERQNLYRDNVQQMQLWADILISMSRQDVKRTTEYISLEKLSIHCHWAIAGLRAIAHSSAHTGWTSSREGFEAVCQVLIFTLVVQSWHPPPLSVIQLKTALFAVEQHLQPLHAEHGKLIDKLNRGLTDMLGKYIDDVMVLIS